MGFLWCPFCKNPHLLTERACPITGNALPTADGKNNRKQSVQIGSLIENKYLLKTRIGNGAYGIVYAAENVTLGGQVALKFLGKQSRDASLRFEQEARIANGLNHPNICRVFDMGSTMGGTPFFVMELLDGITLRRRMLRGALDSQEATSIMTQVLSGLGAAHARGVIHRDIKPENIFLEEREGLDPIAKILDFGLAKLGGPSAKINTAKGVALGTILYMAPEQVKGHSVTQRCDIFACGVVLYEAIAGQHPFRGDTHADTAMRILREDPPPLSSLHPGCPPAFGGVVAKALEKDAEARFATAREFQSALHRALQIVERQPPASMRLPNLAAKDSDQESDEPTVKTIPNAFYRGS